MSACGAAILRAQRLSRRAGAAAQHSSRPDDGHAALRCRPASQAEQPLLKESA